MLPICVRIPTLPDPQAVTLPGGATIEQINLMQAIQPALTPLMPLFDVIDAILAVFQVVQAIPDSLGPPPDPTALAKTIPKLAEKVDKLLRLIPQLSLPYTIVGVVDLILETLTDARDQLVQLQAQMTKIALAVERANALQDAGLLRVTRCAQENVAQEAANIGKSLASLGKLIAMLNLFLGMIGGPQVPDLSELDGRSLENVIEPIDAIVETLKTVRSAVPIP